MLVFLALGNAKVLSFALGDAKVPDANGFASQWNIGFRLRWLAFSYAIFSQEPIFMIFLLKHPRKILLMFYENI